MAELTELGAWEADVQELRDGIYVTLLSPATDNERKAYPLRLPHQGDHWVTVIREYFLPVAMQELADGVKPEEALVNLRISLDHMFDR